MAGLDLDALGATTENETTPVARPEVLESSPETPYTGPGIDLGRLGVTVEAHEDQGQLRRSIDGEQAIQDYSPEDFSSIERFFEQYSPDINSIIFDIESDISAAAEMTEDEIITELGSITLTGEFAELGTQIESKVARIHGLADGEEISLESDDGTYVFETKQQAFLFLYMHKVSIYRVQLFINSLPENEKSALISSIPYLLIGYVGFCMAGSLRRGIVQLRYRVTQGGQRITAIERPEGGSSEQVARLLGEHTEYTQRQQAITLAKRVFQGNENVSNRLGRSLFELFIDARIQDVRGGRIQEQSFWRNMYNTIHQRGIIGQSRDIFLTPYYFNSRESILETLRNADRIRQETIDYFTNGNGQSEIRNMRAFMELDHDVPNTRELEIRDNFDAVRNNLLGGNLDFIFEMDIEQAKAEVRRRLAQPILGDTVDAKRISSIIGDGTNANPGEGGILVRNEVSNFAFITDIGQYEQTLIARTLEARLNDTPYNPDTVRGQLNSFFASIGETGGQNRYTYYSALSVIEKILDGNTKRDAINTSESERGSDLRARISDTDYLVNKNARHIEQVSRDIIARANGIGSLEELRFFQDNILDELRDHNDRFWPGFQSIGRSVDRIIEEKIAAGLPDARVSPTPEPTEGDADADRRPHYHPESIDAALRSQVVFDNTGKMTEDARILFLSNVQAYILNGGELTLEEVEAAERECRANCENIGDMLRELTVLNEENTITDIHNAQAVTIQAQRYSAQDILERSLLQSNNFSEHTNIRLDVRDARIIASVTENGILTYAFDATTLDDLESQIRTELNITGDIVDWDGVNLESYRGRGIDIERFGEYRVLHSIDRFFRRAR